MGNGVKVFGRLSASDPEPFLRGSLKSGIVSLALCSQRINRLKGNGIPLDRKSVVIRKCHIFGAACCFGTLVEAFVTARTVMQMRGALIRTAIFLSGASVIREFSIPVHGYHKRQPWAAT